MSQHTLDDMQLPTAVDPIGLDELEGRLEAPRSDRPEPRPTLPAIRSSNVDQGRAYLVALDPTASDLVFDPTRFAIVVGTRPQRRPLTEAELWKDPLTRWPCEQATASGRACRNDANHLVGDDRVCFIHARQRRVTGEA